MNLVTIDYETFWSKTHSLSKMLPMTYVMHPETEIISCAIKINDEPSKVYFGEKDIAAAFVDIDWDDSLCIAHNMSGFDAMILAWRFNIRPKMYGCTLAMARPIHSINVGNSLAKLVEHYHIGIKDNSALIATQGKHLADFTEQEIEDMRTYNKADTDQCHALFKKLRPHYSAKELWQIDATIRQLVEPKFVVDTDLLEATLVKERNRKTKAVLTLAELLDMDIQGDTSVIEEEVSTRLMSAAKFGEIIKAQGVEVPMKASPSNPEKQVPALAKTDQAFLDLQEHDNEIVAEAARARLAVKSTILETRIQAFLEASDAANGHMPVPINYCGAFTTGRDSGWAYNPQNLPRVSGKLSDALRNSLCAPNGYKIAVADLSGIELRVNMFLWKVPYAMELFKNSPDKADLYRYFAAHDLYNVPEDQISKTQRQVGKVAHLGLGFGAAGATFQKVAKLMGGVDISIDEAKDVVYKYRDAHAEIVQGWRKCHEHLMDIYNGTETAIDPWGLCHTSDLGIHLPSGRIIRYPGLHIERVGDRDEWWYGSGRHRARIYAGKIDENMVQALARDVIKDYKVQIFQATGMRSVLDVHDELVYVVKEDEAENHLATVQRIMRTPPKWWPELITWSEGDIADNYGQAK